MQRLDANHLKPKKSGGVSLEPPIFGLGFLCDSSPMMVCMWSAWRRGSVFAARLATRDWPCRFSAGLSVRYRDFSTKTAPHIPGMEYQCVTLSATCLLACQLATDGCHLHAEHVTDQRQRSGAGSQREISPHLVQVRERIRINGQPIGKELFTKYFWQVYGRLDETKDAHGGMMPAYFRFLTILAFHVFLQEKILGDTIEKIAWQKGGIFKPGVPAFTVKQPEDAMVMLRSRAKEMRSPLRVCPDLEEYQTDCGSLVLGLAGQHQRSNASLALQLSHTWLQNRCLPAETSFPSTSDENTEVLQGAAFTPSPIMVKGESAEQTLNIRTTIRLSAAFWICHSVTYFLDGAHTMRSMKACPCQFDFAVFCPNITEAMASCNAGEIIEPNFNVSVENMLTRCLDNERSWHLHNSQVSNKGSQLLIEGSLPKKTTTDTLVFPCILSALQWITQGRDPVLTDPANRVLPVKPSINAKAAPLCDASEIHILIAGSLHLVGGRSNTWMQLTTIADASAQTPGCS
ncbi:hypothetical protein F7725_015062 [Dissostichus mawsoni]|uniref:Uncharacterized protein n=1 Tax=Dissostichus mawsoni TaxID=36200 RepID=A0A7J5YGK3_DISMA|nr:hypothetical protein F7725_015062 [Dissostichus mawsoni]